MGRGGNIRTEQDITKRTLGSLYVHASRRRFALLGCQQSAAVPSQVVHEEGENGARGHDAAEEDVQEPGEAAAS